MGEKEMVIYFTWDDNDKVREYRLECQNKDAFKLILNTFSSINLLEWKNWKWNVCVFVNPISGLKKANSIVETKLLPKLEMVGLEWTVFKTTHESYMEEFFENLTSNQFPFTDVALCGGDELVSQYI